MGFKDTVKQWFVWDARPSDLQFYQLFNWIWFKDEKIPITAIEEIEGILNAKAEAAVLTYHLTDAAAHVDLFAKTKVYDIGQMQVFKKLAVDDENYIETQQPGDYCVGFVYNEAEELEFISADYLDGDVKLKSSYDI